MKQISLILVEEEQEDEEKEEEEEGIRKKIKWKILKSEQLICHDLVATVYYAGLVFPLCFD